jgi:triosephosphate isomerase
MAKIFIVGNWKCNPVSLRDAKNLINSVKKGIKRLNRNIEVVACPPFVYLQGADRRKKRLKFGAQNCFWEEKGAFTGETSPLMARDLGCEYVILGHSERRKYFKETDGMVNKKIKLALSQGLRPILCIDKISQISKGLKGLSRAEKKKVIVAYEPIWAIGTGRACGYAEAKRFNLLMKKALGRNHPALYGGSVNSKNALGYLKEAGFQGLLIGGASLKAKEFVKIAKIAGEQF